MSSDPAPLLLPIPGDAPAGRAARYEPAFIRLETEIAKIGALDSPPIEWRTVADDAAEILSTVAKDLLAAVYLTRAWYELHGMPGLRDGLVVVSDVVTTHWDEGFPPLNRLRARRAALQWLSDSFAAIPADAEQSVTQACLTLIEQVHAHLLPHVDDGDTGSGGLRRVLQAALSGESPAEATSSATRIATARGSDAIDRDEALYRLRTAAEWFLRTEPHSPVGYLAQRAADLGGKPFHAVFRELLANHQPAQQELWHVLGIPAEPGA